MPVPATNQLVDGAGVRSAVAAGALFWISSDPGTGTLPTNRIMTWQDYKNYIATSGTSQFANNQCPNYQAFLTYAITNPTMVSISASWNYSTISIDVTIHFSGPSGTTAWLEGSSNSGASWTFLANSLPDGVRNVTTYSLTEVQAGVLFRAKAMKSGFSDSAFMTTLTQY